MEKTEKQKSFHDLISSEPMVLVDFFTEWCGPCKTMKPILTEVKSKVGDDLKVVKVDVDRNPKIAFTYSITGVPTLVLFKNGKVAWRQAGVVLTNQLLEVINRHK